MSTFGTATSAGNKNPNKSAEISQRPSDPVVDFVKATLWENQVRCRESLENGTAVFRINTNPNKSAEDVMSTFGTTTSAGNTNPNKSAEDIMSTLGTTTLAGNKNPNKSAEVNSLKVMENGNAVFRMNTNPNKSAEISGPPSDSVARPKAEEGKKGKGKGRGLLQLWKNLKGEKKPKRSGYRRIREKDTTKSISTVNWVVMYRF